MDSKILLEVFCYFLGILVFLLSTALIIYLLLVVFYEASTFHL